MRQQNNNYNMYRKTQCTPKPLSFNKDSSLHFKIPCSAPFSISKIWVWRSNREGHHCQSRVDGGCGGWEGGGEDGGGGGGLKVGGGGSKGWGASAAITPSMDI